MGIERIFAIMQAREDAKGVKPPKVQVYVASISKKGDEILPQRMGVARELWKANISAEFDMNQSDPNLKRQMNEALNQGIPFLVIFGQSELDQGVVKIKDLVNRTEDTVKRGDMAAELVKRGCLTTLGNPAALSAGAAYATASSAGSGAGAGGPGPAPTVNDDSPYYVSHWDETGCALSYGFGGGKTNVAPGSGMGGGNEEKSGAGKKATGESSIKNKNNNKRTKAPAPMKEDSDADDDDLFGDDDDEKDPDAFFKAQGMSAAEIRKKKAQALAHAAKSMAKGSKTQVVFEVKPWEADCDLVGLWKKIISNKMDGLVWGEGHSLVPVAFGVKKLVLSVVMDDQKIQSTEDIEDLINQYEDDVQSCDMTTMNRL